MLLFCVGSMVVKGAMSAQTPNAKSNGPVSTDPNDMVERAFREAAIKRN
jgi:hypothetical protein